MRNLALLVPFLEAPRIELKSLRRLERPGRRRRWPALFGGGSSNGSRPCAPQQLFAEWRLTCYVRLPWAPYVEVNGTTTYTLNAGANQVGRSSPSLPSVPQHRYNGVCQQGHLLHPHQEPGQFLPTALATLLPAADREPRGGLGY